MMGESQLFYRLKSPKHGGGCRERRYIVLSRVDDPTPSCDLARAGTREYPAGPSGVFEQGVTRLMEL